MWWYGEVISGAAHFAFERPAMWVPVVMMEGGWLEMGMASGLLGCVGTDWVSGYGWAPNITSGVG